MNVNPVYRAGAGNGSQSPPHLLSPWSQSPLTHVHGSYGYSFKQNKTKTDLIHENFSWIIYKDILNSIGKSNLVKLLQKSMDCCLLQTGLVHQWFSKWGPRTGSHGIIVLEMQISEAIKQGAVICFNKPSRQMQVEPRCRFKFENHWLPRSISLVQSSPGRAEQETGSWSPSDPLREGFDTVFFLILITKSYYLWGWEVKQKTQKIIVKYPPCTRPLENNCLSKCQSNL